MIQERSIQTLLIILLVLIVSLQSTNLLAVFNLKLNLILVFLVVLSSFLESNKSYLTILFLTSILSSLDKWISHEFIAIFLTGLIIFFLRKKFFSPSIAANAIFIALATFILYIILDPAFIISSPFYIELLSSEILGLILFLIFAKLTGLNYKRLRS